MIQDVERKGLNMITKTIAASLIAGILFTILMRLFTNKKEIKSSRVYLSGLIFTAILFFIFLLLKVF